MDFIVRIKRMHIKKLYLFCIVSFLSIYLESTTIERVTYSAWNKADVELLYVLPSEINNDTKVLFIIHGGSRNADKYLSLWLDDAKNKNVILVAPHFKKEEHPYYQTLGMSTFSGKSIKNEESWLKDSIARFYSFFKNKHNLSSDNYLIYGFSGGSQFVHRYLMYGSDRGIEKAAIGSAGWYTFIQNKPYPYGIKNKPLEPGRLEWLMSSEVLFLLGDKDNDSNHSSLNNSKGAILQGSNRFDRGNNYFNHLIKIGNEFQIPLRWRFSVIKDVDHDTKKMTKPAIDFLLRDLEYKN